MFEHSDDSPTDDATAIARGREHLLLDLQAIIDEAESLMREVKETTAGDAAGLALSLEFRFGRLKGDLRRLRKA